MTQMHLAPAEQAFFMTRGVARVMGVSLSEALATGALSPDCYAGMVTRCRSCQASELCQEWLSAQVALSAEGPPGCANAMALKALQRDGQI